MCRQKFHTCRCGNEYPCNSPNWVCPTLNRDEDANMCDSCLDNWAEDTHRSVLTEYLEDEEFIRDED